MTVNADVDASHAHTTHDHKFANGQRMRIIVRVQFAKKRSPSERERGKMFIFCCKFALRLRTQRVIQPCSIATATQIRRNCVWPAAGTTKLYVLLLLLSVNLSIYSMETLWRTYVRTSTSTTDTFWPPSLRRAWNVKTPRNVTNGEEAFLQNTHTPHAIAYHSRNDANIIRS